MSKADLERENANLRQQLVCASDENDYNRRWQKEYANNRSRNNFLGFTILLVAASAGAFYLGSVI